MSLPVELLALNIEDLKSSVFTLDVWNQLDSTSKEELKVCKTPSSTIEC